MSLPTAIADSDVGHEGHHEVLHALANDVLTPEVFGMARYARGTLAARPAPGRAGSIYEATDESNTYWDNGSAWVDMWDLMQTAELDVTDVAPNIAKLIVPSAELSLSSDYSLAGSAEATVQFDVTERDNSSLVTSVYFEVTRHAIYNVGAVVVWDSDAADDSATNLFARILKNNADYVVGDRRPALASAHMQFDKDVELGAGQNVRLKVQRPGIASGATFIKSDSTKFWIKWVSDV